MSVDAARAREALLAACLPEMQPVALGLYDLLHRAFPKAVQTFDGEHLGFGYSPGYKGLVFVINPQRSWVNLGMSHAVGLHDPHGLLQARARSTNT